MPTTARGRADPDPTRARPGTIARPISGRLYRLTWLVVLLPVVILALSVTEPSPLPESALPASFDGESALTVAETFSSLFPDRVPGTPGAQQATGWVADQMRTAGLTVTSVPFEVSLPELGRRQLVNVVGVLPPRESGRSSRSIVVVAHRDNDGLSPGTNDNATGTAVLLQIAGQVGTTALDHTLVFVSLDGGISGNAGALELARDGTESGSLFSPARALAVVNLDSLGTDGSPRLLFGGNGAAFASPVLVATADARVFDETGSRARTQGPLLQLAQLAAPVTLTDEAPLVESGLSALTITTGGDEPVSQTDDAPGQLDLASLDAAGSSAQQLISTLDGAADVASGTDAYVYLGGRALRGWAIALTLLAALLPVLALTVDLLARCRRRRLRVVPGLRSLGVRALLTVWLAGVVYLLGAIEIIPSGLSSRPLPPDIPAVTTWSVGALVIIAILGVVAYAFAWMRLRRRGRVEPGAFLAGHAAAMIALCLVAIATAIVNPFALIFVLPSLHAWLWLPHLRDRAALVQLGIFALGFLGPAFFVGSLAIRFGIGLDAPWYALTLVAGGAISVPLVLLAALWCACALQIGAILLGRYSPYHEHPNASRGPGGGLAQFLPARLDYASGRKLIWAPASTTPSPRPIRTRASALAADTIRCESCASSGSATGCSSDPWRSSFARTNCSRAASCRTSRPNVPRSNDGSTSRMPRSVPTAGRTSNSKHTRADTGFPGRLKMWCFFRTPNVTGLPGLIATP